MLYGTVTGKSLEICLHQNYRFGLIDMGGHMHTKFISGACKSCSTRIPTVVCPLKTAVIGGAPWFHTLTSHSAVCV